MKYYHINTCFMDFDADTCIIVGLKNSTKKKKRPHKWFVKIIMKFLIFIILKDTLLEDSMNLNQAILL